MSAALWFLAGCGIGGIALVLFALMGMSKRENHNAKLAEHEMNPFEEITITSTLL